MSVKITKDRCLYALAFISVLFNFLTPLFTLVRSMTDKLNEFTDARVSASGYALLGESYYRLMDTVRPTLEAGVVWHIIFSAVALCALVFFIIRRRSNKWYRPVIVSFGVVISLIYTVFGIYGASQARVAGHNLYTVTTYAYIPLIISCIFGVAYFALYNYLADDFTFTIGNGEKAELTTSQYTDNEENKN